MHGKTRNDVDNVSISTNKMNILRHTKFHHALTARFHMLPTPLCGADDAESESY